MDEEFLLKALSKRKEQNLLRKLPGESLPTDLCSNDYLGIVRGSLLYKHYRKRCTEHGNPPSGSTGSRLISGNSAYTEKLESKIAEFHHAQSALIFNSGFDANLGLLSSIAGRSDTFIYDELIHASCRDGISLSKAKSFSFRHNSLSDLREKLSRTKGTVFVVVESIYSMDGDSPDFRSLTALCEEKEAYLIVDEAHATGVVGTRGEGVVLNANVADKVFARVHTFGKALGTHGAAVVGSTALRSHLINFARSFIYTTALPLHSLYLIDCAYDFIESASDLRNMLNANIICFKELARDFTNDLIPSSSAIQSVIFPGSEYAKAAALRCRELGLDVRPILSPTVPSGKERLRICLHAFNTKVEIKKLVEAIMEIKQIDI